MQSGNVSAVPEKTHRGQAVVQQHNRGHGGQWRQHHHVQMMDERDGFISWLRGEFAAANAMIDALCHHLRAIGEPGEYDGVIGCIQQRRYNWNAVLHMQQYFSVAEVIYALQQVGWRRQQRPYEGFVKGGKEFRRGGRGQRGGEGVKDSGKDRQSTLTGEGGNTGKVINGNENMEEKTGEEKKVLVTSSQVDGSIKSIDGGISAGSQCSSDVVDDNGASISKGSSDIENGAKLSHEKQSVIPKTFVGTELVDGKTVNVVDGMKLYEDLIDDSEVSKLVALVNDLKVAGRKGQLQGQTFVVSKRPMRGHGREMIQFGIPIADTSPEDEAGAGASKDRKVEPIPGLLQDLIELLVAKKVITLKSDSCVIDIFNEGDYSQPHIWPHWFGRPVNVLFLTECEMTFGKVIVGDHPGEYRGALRVSLKPGSMLVMQGRSADVARHAIPSQRKMRILVTMTKSEPMRVTTGDTQHFPSSVAPQSHWVPPPSRSPHHIRHPVGQKHYGPLPTTGVLPTPSPQVAAANGIQPIFIAAPVAPAMTFPAPVALAPHSGGWPAAPPINPPPSLPVPGTGVFLPPGSGTLNMPVMSAPTAEDTSTVILSSSEKEIGPRKLNGPSPKGKDGIVQEQDYNGSVDGTDEEKSVEDERQNLDSLATGKPAEAV